MLNLKWLMLGNKNVFTVSEQPRACCYLLRAHGTINFTKKTISNFHKLLLWTLFLLTYWCCFDVEIKKIYHFRLAKRHTWSKVSLYLFLPGVFVKVLLKKTRNVLLAKKHNFPPLDDMQWCIQICLWRQSAQKFSIHKCRRQILRNWRFVRSSKNNLVMRTGLF